jgi:hypothetical protein
VLVERAFRHVGVFGQPLHPGGVDPLAVKQGCCGGEDPLTRSATAAISRPGRGRPCSTHGIKHTEWFTFRTCLDGGVMKWTPETAARGAIEGASVRLRGEASAVSMACPLGIPPAWWMRRRYSSTRSSLLENCW